MILPAYLACPLSVSSSAASSLPLKHSLLSVRPSLYHSFIHVVSKTDVKLQIFCFMTLISRQISTMRPVRNSELTVARDILLLFRMKREIIYTLTHTHVYVCIHLHIFIG